MKKILFFALMLVCGAAFSQYTQPMLTSNNLSDVSSTSTSRTNLGLGTSSTANTGTSGAVIPLLNGANTWSAAQTFGGVVNPSTYTVTSLLVSNAAPTITSGFGSSPSVASNNGTAAFTINVGTGGSATSGVIGLPTAATGWNCYAVDITTNSSTVFITKQTASSTTSATIGNFNTSATAAAWVASDILHVSCFAY